MNSTDAPRLFLDDDDGFVTWCQDHPDGFFWNCVRNRTGDEVYPYMLHATMRNGMLCPHFRNRSRASGIEGNLTTTGYCKLCHDSRSKLERWAKKVRPGFEFSVCSRCVGLP
jgi:hypothetical protein